MPSPFGHCSKFSMNSTLTLGKDYILVNGEIFMRHVTVTLPIQLIWSAHA